MSDPENPLYYIIVDNNGDQEVYLSTTPVLDLDGRSRLLVFDDGSALNLRTKQVRLRGETVIRVLDEDDDKYIHPIVLLRRPPEDITVTLVTMSDSDCYLGNAPPGNITIDTLNTKYNVNITNSTGVQHGNGGTQINHF